MTSQMSSSGLTGDPVEGAAVLSRKLKSALHYWKTGGPGFVARVAADRLVCQVTNWRAANVPKVA